MSAPRAAEMAHPDGALSGNRSAGWLALTPGEPAGIGPDLCVQLAGQGALSRVLLFADPELLLARARLLQRPLHIHAVEAGIPPRPAPADTLYVRPLSLGTPALPGHLDPTNADYVRATLRAAAECCLRGECSALVTGPVHKSLLDTPGQAFTGHTEFLAALAGNLAVVMLLVAPALRVALATTHLPLAAVPGALTAARLRTVLRVLHAGLARDFGLAAPRIAVCGLNPHAGEDGALGNEERESIAPVLDELRAQGWTLLGPLPADTAFTPPTLARCDAVLAMYHDQGLAPLKALAFGQAVNVTLGLPFVRTSVDHGTALALAGRGGADAGSLVAALTLARQLAARRHTSAPAQRAAG